MNAQRTSKIPQKSRFSDLPKAEENRVILEAGKFCLDIAKLIFGGVILAGLMKEDIEYTLLFSIGLLIVGIFTVAGFITLHNLQYKK